MKKTALFLIAIASCCAMSCASKQDSGSRDEKSNQKGDCGCHSSCSCRNASSAI